MPVLTRVLVLLCTLLGSPVWASPGDMIDYLFKFADSAAATASLGAGNLTADRAINPVTVTSLSTGSAVSGYWVIVSSPLSFSSTTFLDNTNLQIALNRKRFLTGSNPVTQQNADAATLMDLKVTPTPAGVMWNFGNLVPYLTGTVPSKFIANHIYSSIAPYNYSLHTYAAITSIGKTPGGGWVYSQPTCPTSAPPASLPCAITYGSQANNVGNTWVYAETQGWDAFYSVSNIPGWAVANQGYGTGVANTVFGGEIVTNAQTTSGCVLHFASIPAGVAANMAVVNTTHSTSVAAGATVVSKSSGDLTITPCVVSTVSSGDTIQIGWWYSNLPPDDRTNTGPIPTFLGDLLTKYNADTGSLAKAIRAVECFVEPANTAPNDPTPANLAIMCGLVHDYLRANWPSILIGTPTLQPGQNTNINTGAYYFNYFAAGGTTEVDFIAVHDYPAITIAAGTPQDLVTNNQKLTRLLQWFDLQDKPIWNTEGSWGIDSTFAGNGGNQANFASWYNMTVYGLNRARSYWYALSGFGWGSLQTASGGSWTGATAGSPTYISTAGWLTGAKLLAPGMSYDGTSVFTWNFTLSGNIPATAYLDTVGSTKTIPTAYTSCVDASGGTVTITAHQITISPLAVLCQ